MLKYKVINWQQLDSKEHKAGMRLECYACTTVQYFGDSPAGDLALYKARDEHNCIEERRSALLNDN